MNYATSFNPPYQKLLLSPAKIESSSIEFGLEIVNDISITINAIIILQEEGFMESY